MFKKDLRSDYKNHRKSLSEHLVADSSLAIANRVLQLSLWHCNFFHLFLPILQQREVDTTALLSILQGKDKNVVIPKVTGSNVLTHYLLTDVTKFSTNRWNIPEPVEGIEIDANKIDVVFVPLLAFDRKGNRVGYGKGFYDRFLRECRDDVIKIGLSFFEAEEIIDDTDEYDVPLDYCVTPKKIYSFSDLDLDT